MPATATASLICDGCQEETNVELDGPGVFSSTSVNTIEEAVDQEGWSWHGPTLGELLCDTCAEAREEES